MPEVGAGESLNSYLARCIPHVMNKEGLTKNRAAGKCAGMYRHHRKESRKKKIKKANRSGKAIEIKE